MATLTPQRADFDGLTPVFSAADVAGDEFPWAQQTVLYVKNGDAVPHTVTIASQYTARCGVSVAIALPQIGWIYPPSIIG